MSIPLSRPLMDKIARPGRGSKKFLLVNILEAKKGETFFCEIPQKKNKKSIPPRKGKTNIHPKQREKRIPPRKGNSCVKSAPVQKTDQFVFEILPRKGKRSNHKAGYDSGPKGRCQSSN